MHNLETRYKAVVHYKYFQRSLRLVSRLYGVSKSSLHRWIQKSNLFQKIGKSKSKKTRGIQDNVKECINNSIKNNPFLTMKELASIISKECNLKRSSRSVNRYVQQQNITLKSATRMVNIIHDNGKVKEFCRNYINACDSENLISIDETGFYVGENHIIGKKDGH